MTIDRPNCFLCDTPGSPKARQTYWVEHPFEILWCNECEVGWVSRLPDHEVIVEGYERWNVLSWKDKTQDSLRRDITRAYLKGFRVGREFLAVAAPRDRRGLRVLEIGSNIGAVLKGCMDAIGLSTDQLQGVDFSKNHAEIAREKFGFPTAAMTLSDFAQTTNQRFDLVISHHIIEHDPAPVEFCADIARLLRPGGVASFELPNGLRELAALSAVNRQGIIPNTVINHVNFFSPRGFGRLVKSQRFAIRTLNTFNARRVLQDFGLVKPEPATGRTLRFADVPNTSVLEVFESQTIDRAIAAAARVAPYKRAVHRYLRAHYPPWLPIGRDIEAVALRED